MDQVLQVIGALMILAAFTLAQFQMLDQRSYSYLLLNLIGSALLAVLAFLERQWGFLLLEGVGAGVAVGGRRPSSPAPAHDRHERLTGWGK